MFQKILSLLFPKKSSVELAKLYNIPSQIRFDFETTTEGWIVATSPDLPGFITEAKSVRELAAMINDGILTYFDVPQRVARRLDGTFTVDGHGIASISSGAQFAWT